MSVTAGAVDSVRQRLTTTRRHRADAREQTARLMARRHGRGRAADICETAMAGRRQTVRWDWSEYRRREGGWKRCDADSRRVGSGRMAGEWVVCVSSC